MATKSITKNIDIRKKRLAHSFVTALEHSREKKAKEVSYSKKLVEVKGNSLSEMFKSMK